MFDCVQQDEFCLREVVAHVASYHTARSVTRNEQNWGVGLRFQSTTSRLFWTAGQYRNSLNNNTFYAAVGTELFSAGPLSLRVIGGLVTGYNIPVVPAVIPELALTWRGVGVAVNYVPHLSNNLPEVFGFSLIKRF